MLLVLPGTLGANAVALLAVTAGRRQDPSLGPFLEKLLEGWGVALRADVLGGKNPSSRLPRGVGVEGYLTFRTKVTHEGSTAQAWAMAMTAFGVPSKPCRLRSGFL